MSSISAFVPAVVGAFLISFLCGLLLIKTRHWHGQFTLDRDVGVQKLHSAPTPRIGGVAVLAGAIAGGAALPDQARLLWWALCLAALPGFAMGLAEDVTKKIGVRARLLATISSGLIFCLATGYSIGPIGIPGLDQLLDIQLISVMFTAFAIGGIANAINIVDGVNGLASGTVILILTGFATLAWQTQDTALLGVCLLILGCCAGFFLLNFPLGLIFFGDAGAYTAGFLLAGIAVMLPLRNPELSPLIGLVALAYPVIETMVSIRRRLVRRGAHPGQPDRLHLHSLVYRDLSRRLAQAVGAPQMRNPITALVVLALPLLSVLLLSVCATSILASWTCLAAVLLVYLMAYRRVAMMTPLHHSLRAVLRRPPLAKTLLRRDGRARSWLRPRFGNRAP